MAELRVTPAPTVSRTPVLKTRPSSTPESGLSTDLLNQEIKCTAFTVVMEEIRHNRNIPEEERSKALEDIRKRMNKERCPDPRDNRASPAPPSSIPSLSLPSDNIASTRKGERITYDELLVGRDIPKGWEGELKGLPIVILKEFLLQAGRLTEQEARPGNDEERQTLDKRTAEVYRKALKDWKDAQARKPRAERIRFPEFLQAEVEARERGR